MNATLALIVLEGSILLGQSGEPPFCAVELSVSLARGGGADGAEAELVDQLGNVRERRHVSRGRAEFCDFGFGPHSITVRHYGNTTVTLSGIRLVYGETQRFHVVLNASPQIGDVLTLGTACTAYLRVVDQDNRKPIGGAKASDSARNPASDEFGRLRILVPLLRFTTFTLRRDGYVPRAVVLGCARAEELIEQEIALEKARGR